MNYAYIAAAVLSLLISGFSGYKIAAAGYEKQIAGMQQSQDHAVIAAQQKAAEVEKTQQSKSQEIANAYAKDVDVISRYYAGRLRKQPAVRSSVPAVAQSAASPAADASDAGLAERCTQTTLMLVDLQKWIKSEGLE